MPAAPAAPPATDRTQLVADAALAPASWDGVEADPWDEDYDDYLAKMPSKEERRPYKTPARYWEVAYPGIALQPYPRMGAFESTASGLWEGQNQAQEAAIRDHIRMTAQVDPDELRISDEDWAVMSGAKPGDIRFCHTNACMFVSCNPRAYGLHERLNGHETKAHPRKDR